MIIYLLLVPYLILIPTWIYFTLKQEGRKSIVLGLTTIILVAFGFFSIGRDTQKINSNVHFRVGVKELISGSIVLLEKDEDKLLLKKLKEFQKSYAPDYLTDSLYMLNQTREIFNKQETREQTAGEE